MYLNISSDMQNSHVAEWITIDEFANQNKIKYFSQLHFYISQNFKDKFWRKNKNSWLPLKYKYLQIICKLNSQRLEVDRFRSIYIVSSELKLKYQLKLII